jgi:hypothetical protein
MQTVTSFSASAMPPEQLKAVLAAHLALDRARFFRRLLVRRCGMLAWLATLLGIVHGFSLPARLIMFGMCLLPPAWAWIVELRVERHLSHRLAGAEALATHNVLASAGSRGRQDKKVVKSS